MRKFRGSYEELQQLVATTGVDGEWIEQKSQAQYRADSGAVLNFWSSTGTVNFQGPPSAANELEAAVFHVSTEKMQASKAQRDSIRAAIDYVALRSLAKTIIQNRIGPTFDEESARLCMIARECMLDLCERLGLVA